MGKHSVSNRPKQPETSTFDPQEVVEQFGRETKTHRKQSRRRRASMVGVAALGLFYGMNFIGGEEPANTVASQGNPYEQGDSSSDSGSEQKQSPKPEFTAASLACDLSGVGSPESVSGGNFYELTLTNSADAMPESYKVVTYQQGGQTEQSSISLGVYNADSKQFDSSAHEVHGANEQLGIIVPEGLLESGKSVVVYAEKDDQVDLCGGVGLVDGAIEYGSTANDYPAQP